MSVYDSMFSIFNEPALWRRASHFFLSHSYKHESLMRVSVPPLQALKSESALYILYNFDKTHSGEGWSPNYRPVAPRDAKHHVSHRAPPHAAVCCFFHGRANLAHAIFYKKNGVNGPEPHCWRSTSGVYGWEFSLTLNASHFQHLNQ